MTFHAAEAEAINDILPSPTVSKPWRDSGMGDLLHAPPATKGKFARDLIRALAREAGTPVSTLKGPTRSRLRIGSTICEIKFSMEDPARFQQVRPPEYGYEALIAIGAHPNQFVYWLFSADDVHQLVDDGQIFIQHAEDSMWFFPEADAPDPFSAWRHDTAEMISAMKAFA